LPGNKTGAQLTLDKPIRQNFLSFIYVIRHRGIRGGGQRPVTYRI